MAWRLAAEVILRLVALGSKMPDWVERGYREYAGRMPRECQLQLVELPLPRRGKNPDLGRLREREADSLLSAARGARIVALDEAGHQPPTRELARWLAGWMSSGQDVAFLIGGPDGLAQRCISGAERVWSLSRATLPHQLVRILVAEQCYRALSILRGHPYHRE